MFMIKNIFEKIARFKNFVQNTRSTNTLISTTTVYPGKNLSYLAFVNHKNYTAIPKTAIFILDSGYRINPNVYCFP